ncbi:helix-hairpin-helix domain-containing protein [Vreelandella neptunia]|uniref:Helix-hairpin-helix domain-containing protein n=1 Tax=Vreelandella neptunia TaxID=115551 RepID=A0ABS9SB68_9GAMM|nr:helix-hairpin-helix domain-containing protein [Halomonas neptunia]MCH4813344.1 helix-hairpin-helix domain-containing protein [Halomonas neptunia]
MTDEPNDTAALPTVQLRDAVNTLMHTVTTLLEDKASPTTLETALHSHDALLDQLAMLSLDGSTLAALERIEQFITLCAGDYYQSAAAKLDEQQQNRFISVFARRLLALDGLGPATARQLFQLGVFTPEQFFALTPKALAQLQLPPATLARLIPLHAQHSSLTRDSQTS